MTPGGNCSHRIWNCKIFILKQMILSEENVSICIHLVIDVGHFVIAAFHLARIYADQHWIFCHLILLYQRLLLDKCTCVTSISKYVIPLGYSASGVTQKALKRLNGSEQEPDSMCVILCQCCFDIVWVLVETNHLGLIEKLVNRKGETKRNP